MHLVENLIWPSFLYCLSLAEMIVVDVALARQPVEDLSADVSRLFQLTAAVVVHRQVAVGYSVLPVDVGDLGQ